jgi:hypothetical protein
MTANQRRAAWKTRWDQQPSAELQQQNVEEQLR